MSTSNVSGNASKAQPKPLASSQGGRQPASNMVSLCIQPSCQSSVQKMGSDWLPLKNLPPRPEHAEKDHGKRAVNQSTSLQHPNSIDFLLESKRHPQQPVRARLQERLINHPEVPKSKLLEQKLEDLYFRNLLQFNLKNSQEKLIQRNSTFYDKPYAKCQECQTSLIKCSRCLNEFVAASQEKQTLGKLQPTPQLPPHQTNLKVLQKQVKKPPDEDTSKENQPGSLPIHYTRCIVSSYRPITVVGHNKLANGNNLNNSEQSIRYLNEEDAVEQKDEPGYPTRISNLNNTISHSGSNRFTGSNTLAQPGHAPITNSGSNTLISASQQSSNCLSHNAR